VSPGGSVVLRLRLCEARAGVTLDGADEVVAQRRREADEFYASLHPPGAGAEERLVQRRVLAGLLWSKQPYLFDVARWLDAAGPSQAPGADLARRHRPWAHLSSQAVFVMPDKWEFPWYAAWDSAFQCVALALVDVRSAKDQLAAILSEQFQHPNGQIPAYEYDFSDVHPPVHAWAVWRVYAAERAQTGEGDRTWLERCFHKLQLCFSWWVNKVDREGHNVFGGGFLGLDNIAVVDRSLPPGGDATLEQADATGWMGRFCLDLMRIALELAADSAAYEGLAVTFLRHFADVAAALRHPGGRNSQLWDEEDGFFYDVLRHPDGSFRRLRVRSLVGLIPLLALEVLEADRVRRFEGFAAALERLSERHAEPGGGAIHAVRRDGRDLRVLSLVSRERAGRLLRRLWDPDEFLSPHGVRTLSRAHAAAPFRFGEHEVGYEPGDSVSKIKGGNSNWRGPVWVSPCYLLIEALRKLGEAYGEAPLPGAAGGPGCATMAGELTDRLIRLFTPDPATGRRPVFGGADRFRDDPHWRDLLLFFEAFHGDSGVGVGASHHTGWAALIAKLIDEHRRG
jgi:hypothetical protein